MASLQKVRAQGRTYWRIVESRRIKGKPRALPILPLSTADALLNRLLASPAGSFTVQSFQHGDVAALKAVADRLEVVTTIDRHAGGRARSPSVGTTLLLAAINRAVRPCSKGGWAAWAGTTSLSPLFPGLRLERLTSPYFWEQMDGIEIATLPAIEAALTRTVVTELGIELDTLCYDTTNFFTYIASTNERSTLTQRGHSKQKRHALRLFSGQYLKQVLSIRYDLERQGAERLPYHLDQDAIRHLENEVFDKRLLITDRHDWSDEDILRAYRGQSHVEGAFRQLKDDDHLAVRPQYHWTDQKVHVHTFIYLLGLLLARGLEYEARRQGYAQGLSALLELLATLRLARVLSPAPTPGGRPRCTWQMEQPDPQAWLLFCQLVPAQPPFVYT